MKSLFVCLLIIFISPTLTIATEVELYKYNVIAKCVQFISTDTLSFPKNNLAQTYNGESLLELKEHFAKLQGVSNKIDEISNYPINMDNKESLNVTSIAFKNRALQLILLNKSYRTKLDGYSELTNQLGLLQKEIIDNYKPALVNTFRIIDYILFSLLFLTLLILLSYIFINKNKLNTKSVETKKEVNSSEFIKKDELEQLKSNILKIQEKLEKLEKEFENIQKTTKVKNINNEVELEIKEVSTFKNVPTQQKENTNQLPAKKIMYAENYHSSGGFIISKLTEHSSKTSVFKITITDEKNAIFEINTNPEVQSLALRYFESYFSKSADFNSYPNNNTKAIKTNTVGTLVNKNNEIWEITKKVNISLD